MNLLTENSERLLKLLHIKTGHTGSKDLYCEAHARGWLITKESCCCTCISVCSLYHSRLHKHPSDQTPLHVKRGNGLWETWQVDYTGPF